jgi:hypothetical protein
MCYRIRGVHCCLKMIQGTTKQKLSSESACLDFLNSNFVGTRHTMHFSSLLFAYVVRARLEHTPNS